MDVLCDLQPHVNGEEILLINKNPISSYYRKFTKLFNKSKTENFELVTSSRYNDSEINTNPNTARVTDTPELISGIRNSLEKPKNWLEFSSWPQFLSALKQPQDSEILRKCLDSFVLRLTFATEMSPACAFSSPESSGLCASADSRSSIESRLTWWFEDLVAILAPDSIRMLVKSMILHQCDHGLITKFLIFYKRSRFIVANLEEKREIMEAIMDSICLLDRNSISCKILFGILRVSANLNVKKPCKSGLERMIGLKLDQTTLDDLLIPSPHGSDCLYDVNLVLRFVKYFMLGDKITVRKLRKVAGLMDSYAVEVAPDPRLEPSKFVALVNALPNSARDSYDEIYHAIDIYLQVHIGILNKEMMSLCESLNYEKLSLETSNHLTKNAGFPSRFAALALKTQQIELENMLHFVNGEKTVIGSPCPKTGFEQVVLYTGKAVLLNDENEKMRTQIQGMQWRVVELEKVCRKMQVEIGKILKSRFSSQSRATSLPRLCS